MKQVTTFGQRSEFEKAAARLAALGLPYETISPDPGYSRVGAPALVLAEETRLALAACGGDDFICSGWIEYRPPRIAVPAEPPPALEEDIVGEVAIMVLVPCVADKSRIRFIAHVGGELAQAMPYLNAERREASYNPKAETLSFMDRYRLITLYPRRIVVAKADDLVDGWRVLEMARRLVGDVWARRASIQPCRETREKPPALEIYKHLPGTNCRTCGQRTCLAFAVMVHEGDLPVTRCRPIFEGDFGHLKDAILQVCASLATET